MKPIEWLEQNAHGFNTLSEPEREAISNFSLLWSFFEARALATRGSSHAILALTHKWSSQGLLDVQNFSASLQYFQQRYYSNSVATKHLASLNLRANDCPELIALDIKMGGGFIPTVNSNMNQLQKDFIVVFSHIEDYTPELLESLIAIFMRCKDST